MDINISINTANINENTYIVNITHLSSELLMVNDTMILLIHF